jgi:hypothetical protein
MDTGKTQLTIACAIGLILSQMGCAGSYMTYAPKSSQGKKTYYSSGDTYDNVEVEDGSNDSSAEDEDDSGGGSDPTISFEVRGVGYVSKSFTVKANQKLRLRFSPGRQDRKVSGTGFTPIYAQLGVYIKVGTDEQPTALLSNGLMREATSTPVMDFSGSFTKTCGSNTACRQNVTITVKKPNYDYWCYNYGLYCAYTHVHDTHPWVGYLEVETDDTVAIAE